MSDFFVDFGTAYLIGQCVAWVGLFVSLAVFAWLRPWRSAKSPVRLAGRVFLLVWSFSILALALETGFALVYDTTDSFNMLNTSQRWHRRHVRLNNMGFRDRKDFFPHVADGKKRIVLMGDSFAFGHGITRLEQRLGDRIEAKLDATYPGKFEFYNTALSGFDTEHHLHLLNKWGRAGFEADAIVLVYVLNDIEHLIPQNDAILNAIAAHEPTFWLWRDTYLFNFLYYRYRQLSHPELIDYFGWIKDAYQGEIWETQKRRLDLLRASCHDQGIPLHVVLFPFLQNMGERYPFRRAHAVLADYWQSGGVPVLDLLPVMEAHAHEPLMVHRFEAHPSAHAHALAAETMWDKLVRDLALDLLQSSE